MKHKVNLYNTLTKKVGALHPVSDKEITIYSCGPTLYDHIHIGNLSSFIYADTLKRVLLVAGYKVNHVMNFTDVDDKTIAKSKEKYPEDDPNVALKKLTEEYRDLFLDDMKSVGNLIDDITFMPATNYIDEMKSLITELHKNGFAYIADDGIYFSIDKYQKSGKKYGQLSNINSDSTSNARISNDEYDKESVHDFALWKLHKDDEPSWEFTLDGHKLNGRPGWHIECSAMSTKALGIPFDIHTGGVDLIFPHHENEIAQSTAGQQSAALANLFFHNEHLLVDGKKMSKSLHNFYTLEDIKERGFDPLAFRLLTLQSHYRKQSNFTWQNLDASQNRLKSFNAWADLQHQADDEYGSLGNDYFSQLSNNINKGARNDLMIPGTLAYINESIEHINRYAGGGISIVNDSQFEEFLEYLDEMLGLSLSSRATISHKQLDIIKARQVARDAKNWDEADKLRYLLKQQGIELKDTVTWQIWYRS